MKFITITLLLAAAVMVAAMYDGDSDAFQQVDQVEDVDVQFVAFQSFVKRFNRQYESEEEMMARYEIFQNNMARVEQLKQEYEERTGVSGEGVFGVTKFSDLTFEEFSKQFKGYFPRGIAQDAEVKKPISTLAVPTSVDWRQQNKVTPVKDQGQCGSCWAFSAGEEVESAYAMQYNSTVLVSIQQIVSCDTVDAGCNGGDTITAYQYIQGAKGLEAQSSYPYTSGGGDTGSCKSKSGEQIVTVVNYTYATAPCTGSCSSQDVNSLRANLATGGPVSVCLNANDGWQNYVGGVFDGSCPHAYSDLDHCVQLVGYKQGSYWLVRNSWNTDWGEQGYIRLSDQSSGGNLCGIADEATQLTVAKV